MDLIFEKKEQYWGKDAAWVSEFEVTADFNLHIERVSGGRFLVYQKSVADGEYDLVDGLGYKDHKDTIDMDFVALVYPKWIKVVSEAEVTMGIVTFTGDAPSGGGSQGGGEEMIFFDYEKLGNVEGFGYYSMSEVLSYLTVNTYRQYVPVGYGTYYSLMGEERIAEGFSRYQSYQYVAFPKTLVVPALLHFGSQAIPAGDLAGQTMDFYDFLENANEVITEASGGDFTIQIDGIKSCEVTKEEVMSWLDAQS